MYGLRRTVSAMASRVLSDADTSMRTRSWATEGNALTRTTHVSRRVFMGCRLTISRRRRVAMKMRRRAGYRDWCLHKCLSLIEHRAGYASIGAAEIGGTRPGRKRTSSWCSNEVAIRRPRRRSRRDSSSGSAAIRLSRARARRRRRGRPRRARRASRRLRSRLSGSLRSAATCGSRL